MPLSGLMSSLSSRPSLFCSYMLAELPFLPADACPMNRHSLPFCQILTYIILTSGTVNEQAYRNSQGRTPPRHPLMDQLSHGVMP